MGCRTSIYRYPSGLGILSFGLLGFRSGEDSVLVIVVIGLRIPLRQLLTVKLLKLVLLVWPRHRVALTAC